VRDTFVAELAGARERSERGVHGVRDFDRDLSPWLLERTGEAYSPCPEPPVVACTTASDCPRGLACNDAGKCVSCYDGCYAEEYGGCARCSDEELCVAAFCMPRENAQCATRLDCEQGSDCVLSGMDLTGGRGNAQTSSLCQSMVTPG
jgi:hypothetical protein